MLEAEPGQCWHTVCICVCLTTNTAHRCHACNPAACCCGLFISLQQVGSQPSPAIAYPPGSFPAAVGPPAGVAHAIHRRAERQRCSSRAGCGDHQRWNLEWCCSVGRATAVWRHCCKHSGPLETAEHYRSSKHELQPWLLAFCFRARWHCWLLQLQQQQHSWQHAFCSPSCTVLVGGPGACEGWRGVPFGCLPQHSQVGLPY